VQEVLDRATQLRAKGATLTDALAGAKDWQVLVVDRYGVLVDLYRVANLVVMGGTFNPKVGGHNILEATALGKPVVVGPVTFGITAQVRMLDSAGALEHAEWGPHLMAKVKELLKNPARATAIGQAAKEVTDSNRGAAARAAAQVGSLLPAPTMQP
jgi:3-deoxy-D-manno-octulosonic-acid transferase